MIVYKTHEIRRVSNNDEAIDLHSKNIHHHKTDTKMEMGNPVHCRENTMYHSGVREHDKF
jgi:hypothetical protein